ncbi:hypothetical protein BGX28_007444 [Mortierella sp. GBA30]|nr:hypothetical protein BGX28_007444 [Mortierella sp. GBA30]
MINTATTPSKTGPNAKVDVPVLITGGGPTGLFTALLLTKMGIPCRLIERHLEISSLSKALVIHARQLEIFDMVGANALDGNGVCQERGRNSLLETFLNEGKALADFNIYFGDRLTSILPALKNKESHYNFGLFIEQTRTVAILTEELEKLGVRVDRGWELLDTKVVEADSPLGSNQNEGQGKTSWVETTIRRARVGTNARSTESKVLGTVELEGDEDGKEYDVEVVRSEYMIATDGGKSAVRHKLNIGFPGRTLDNNIILYDGHVKANIPLSTVTIINGDGGRSLAIFPLRGNRIRIMLDNGTLTPEEHKAQRSEDLTLTKFQDMVNATAAPLQLELLDCDWLTYYRVNERLAERYSHKGRIFLAGDAAHVHSPAGGQGMNMGLQDAYNLTWKLALVLKGSADETLLDSYEAERPKVAEDIIRLSAGLLEVSMAQNVFRRMLRRLSLTVLPYVLPYMSQGPPMSMLRIRYHENAINRNHASRPKLAEEHQVGVRARDGTLHIIEESSGLHSKSDETIRLHKLLTGPGIFHILVFASDMMARTTVASTIKGAGTFTSASIAKYAEEHLERWRTRWVSRPSQDRLFMVHVLSSSMPSESTGEGRVYLDQDGALHQKYGVHARGGPGAMVVLRPDSYIGYRVQGASESAWKDVDEYFGSIMSNTIESKL